MIWGSDDCRGYVIRVFYVDRHKHDETKDLQQSLIAKRKSRLFCPKL